MIKLKNISKQGECISCDFLVEDSDDYGHLVYNVAKKDIVSCNLPENYEWCENHIAHAIHFFDGLKDDIPKNKLLMW